MRSSASEVAPRPDKISIFVGTWNMAEQGLPDKISDWIPTDRDLYAIGLQECMDARSVRGVLSNAWSASAPSCLRLYLYLYLYL